MKRLILFLSLFTILTSRCADAKIVDKVIATVNGEVITEGEIESALNPLYMQYKSEYSKAELDKKMKALRAKLISDLIDDKLLLSQARKEGITATAQEIEKRLEEIKSTFSSKDDFENALSYQHITVSDLKERFKSEIIKSKLIDQKVKSYLEVTPKEISDYYKTNEPEFKEYEAVHLGMIFIKKDETTDVKSSAYDTIKLLRNGADFSEIAKKYSNAGNAQAGGDMGVVRRGSYKDTIEKVIFALKENEISEPLESESGFYIFKAGEKIPSHTKDFNEVRDFIKNRLYIEKAQAKLREYIDFLKKNAYIAIK